MQENNSEKSFAKVRINWVIRIYAQLSANPYNIRNSLEQVIAY